MTDLLSRPRTSPSGSPSAGPRPLAMGAAIASVGAALATMLVSMAVCLVGWFLADGGAHGQTTDALRVGADVWLVGHGSGLTVQGLPLHVVPLGLTLVFGLVIFRLGRWAAATSAPPEDDRAVLTAAVTHSGIYLVVTVLTCLLVGSDAASPGLGRAIVGALLLSLVGGLGIASGTGHLASWSARVPGWGRAVTHGAVAGFLLLLAASALLVAVGVALGLNRSSTIMSELHLSTGDYVMYAVATIAIVPNAVLLGAAYLLGPGFAVGTGTTVSPTLVSLGQVPAFPLLGALPGDGTPSPAFLALLALPVLAGMGAAVLSQRAHRVTAYDSAALRGFGSGLGAALLTTLAVSLAGGAMGSGRMADLGAPFGEVLVTSVAAMSLGGLVAGVVTAWVQRRRDG